MKKNGPDPSVEKYVWALPQKATDCSRKMLQKHYQAPQRTLTAQQMSRKMGWTGKAANGPYGTFAGKLRRLLTREDLEFQIEVLCSFEEEETERVQWIMHENVASALERLGWV